MKLLRHCIAAFRFLTIFPFPGSFGTELEDLRGSLPFFPLVGLVLGLLSWAAAWLAWQFPLPLVAAAILVFALFSFSGALHLDGLADTADGFFSSRSRERMLEIMRDSRTGVMGVIAVVMVLLFKVSALSGLDPDSAARAALLMPLAGRFALVMMICLLPYVRKEGGLGSPFYSGSAGVSFMVSLALFFAAGFVALGIKGLIAAACVGAAVFAFSLLCRIKIGGATGDALGASCELAETVVPLVLVFVLA